MISMSVNFEGGGALRGIRVEEADSIEAIVLDRGMGTSGRPSVTLHFTVAGSQERPGGKHFVAQTSARLFCTVAKMIEAKYPDLFSEP